MFFNRPTRGYQEWSSVSDTCFQPRQRPRLKAGKDEVSMVIHRTWRGPSGNTVDRPHIPPTKTCEARTDTLARRFVPHRAVQGGINQ